MALEDVARFVAPRRQAIVLKIIQAFYGRQSITRDELLKETELSPKAFEYYLTKFRRARLIGGRKYRDGVYRYHLSVDGFHSRIDTLLVDPLRTLAEKSRG